MDINALLQMLQGGGQSLQGGSGGITAPIAPQMANPSFQMPQFAGAGSNAGPQQAAMAARQALATPPPQQQSPMGGMMGSSNPMMMAMMMQKMQNQNQPAPSAPISYPDMRGNPVQSTVQAPFPNISGSTGLQGIFSRLFGG